MNNYRAVKVSEFLFEREGKYKPNCIASYDYELAWRQPLQLARESLTELKQQMAAEGDSHG